jgi:allantoate deiminase
MFYPAAEPDAPRLFIGSHLDTVPDAGAYDGILGVVLAVALLSAVHDRRFSFAIEAVGFSEEEGVRFGTPFIGSRALVGSLDEETLCRHDAQGISIREAIKKFGLNPEEIAQAAMHEDVLGYIEFHIEQGPMLENAGRPLAVVEAIAGQSRLEFTFVGHANHAGTTPMNVRHDALATAAEWICTVERHAQTTSGLVATVGAIQAKPGAGNVIAGETRLSLDVRHPSDEARNAAVDYFVRQGKILPRVWAKSEMECVDGPVGRRWTLSESKKLAIGKTGCAPRIVSGAGHDATSGGKNPPAMIFL